MRDSHSSTQSLHVRPIIHKAQVATGERFTVTVPLGIKAGEEIRVAFPGSKATRLFKLPADAKAGETVEVSIAPRTGMLERDEDASGIGDDNGESWADDVADAARSIFAPEEVENSSEEEEGGIGAHVLRFVRIIIIIFFVMSAFFLSWHAVVVCPPPPPNPTFPIPLPHPSPFLSPTRGTVGAG